MGSNPSASAKLARGVIGNTRGFDPLISGSSPDGSANVGVPELVTA